MIEIRDGGDLTGKLIGSYFGTKPPGIIVTSGNQIFIKMKTGKSVTSKGFEASYEKGKNTLLMYLYNLTVIR